MPGYGPNQLKGRPRRRLTAAVRARHKPCPMCGYPIDQTLDRQRHPLGSQVDEWLPRILGGNPLDPANCVEMHRWCGTSKGSTWPVTQAMRDRCRSHVAALLAHHATPTITPW